MRRCQWKYMVLATDESSVPSTIPATLNRQSPGKISLESGMTSPTLKPKRRTRPLPTMQELRSARKSALLPATKRMLKTSSALFASMANWAKKFFRSL